MRAIAQYIKVTDKLCVKFGVGKSILADTSSSFLQFLSYPIPKVQRETTYVLTFIENLKKSVAVLLTFDF